MRFVPWAAALLALAGGVGCEAGSPPSSGPDASQGDATVDGSSDTGVDACALSPCYAICPEGGLDASFGAIYTGVLATDGCGYRTNGCHTTRSAVGTGNHLDYSLDASAVYAELLGDGGGAPASDPCGDAGGAVLLRVVPHDAGASFLYVKLTLTAFDPRYGNGMPLFTPGSVCPPALDAIKTWIDDGAQPN